MVVPGQSYPYVYPTPSPYGPPLMSEPRVVVVPAQPAPPYHLSASVDALFLERSSGGSVPLGYAAYSQSSPAMAGLYSDDTLFPLEAGLRLELSRKFDNNITLSATYWGLQQWSVGDAIYGDAYDFAYPVLNYSPYLKLSSPANLNGFDDSLSYTYRSQIQNVEFNAMYRLNSFNPYCELNWLVGARYVYFSDGLTLTGVDDYYQATEQLTSNTTNNLVGVQTGLQFTHGWARFQWDFGFKVGLMANLYQQQKTDTASEVGGLPAGYNPYDVSNKSSDLSALFEVTLGARYRLSDNLWLRLGYQVYDITGLALAPKQLGGYNHTGNVCLDGFSIGLQATF